MKGLYHQGKSDLMDRFICDKCKKEIKYKEDLIVVPKNTPFFVIPLSLKTFHNSCYSKKIKSPSGFFLSGPNPINSKSYGKFLVAGYVILLFGSLALLSGVQWNISKLSFNSILLLLIFAYFMIITGVPKVLSHYRYEKALPSKNAK